MELWGGVECTVNRVGDAWRDQLRESGHHDRIADLALFAGLGIKRLRYPVLWERVAPDQPGTFDWTWSDERLGEIIRLGMQPIVGLLHHGSGPRYTDLLDPEFATKFARYARAVAERYPWVQDWTPINEPLTTARFAALYGHWYPHRRDEHAFFTALFNQIEATRLAMAEIRRVNPRARLIQTDDLGQTWSTPRCARVARYYNTRRWLGWDLLTGRVGKAHPLWRRIQTAGLAARAETIGEVACPPDVIGINHYVTSHRFLDHRGTAGETGYSDVTAARVLDPSPEGVAPMLRQAWRRYGIPVAVTEWHLGCTREEQLRWLVEGWSAAQELAAEGVPVAGFTPWALIGAYDWDSLITEQRGNYEPGAFDLRGGTPRPTALASCVRALPTGGDLHPAAVGPGWWRRPCRFEHPAFALPQPAIPESPLPPSQPILITGATGTLGRAFAAACAARGLAHVITYRARLAIDRPEQIAAVLDDIRPWAVINAAGFVRVDDAEGEIDACMRANAHAVAHLANACVSRDIHLTVFSSDLVFDGAKDGAYVEDDRPTPLGIYGRSKAEAESYARNAGDRTLIVRTAAFFSDFDPHNFAAHVVRQLRAGHRVQASAGHVVTPTFVPHLVDACLDLIVDGECGIWHLTNGEAMSWRDFARRIATAVDLDVSRIEATDPAALGWRAPRPRQAALASTRGIVMPSFEEAVMRFAEAVVCDRAELAA